MNLRISLLLVLTLCFTGTLAAQDYTPQATPETKEPIEVMVFGTFHFDNPGRDAFNPRVPDVLTPEKQREIRQLVDSLARFRPTKIAFEDEPKEFSHHDSLYQAYRRGEHDLNKYEWEQIGFRLAKTMNHARVYPVDHEMTLPFGPMIQYAKKHDTSAVNHFMSWGRQMKQRADSLLQHKPIYEALKLSNSRSFREGIEAVRARMMTVGTDTNYVGADLQARWHKRNMRIFANIEDIAEPGDRIFVIFGGGHSPILRELVRESRRMKLIEPLDYF